MGFGRRKDENETAAAHIATSRWTEVAESVTAGYARLEHLPLEDAVEAAWMMTPGGMSREELARRLAERRSATGTTGTTSPEA